MATTHTTNTLVPYAQRPLSLAKFIDDSHMYMNLVKDHFPDLDSYMYFLSQRDRLKNLFKDLRGEYDNSPQRIALVQLKQFYHEIFDKKIDLDQMTMALHTCADMRLMYIPHSIHVRDIVDLITNKYFRVEFSADTKTCLNKIKAPDRGYFFWWSGHREHDREYSGMRLNTMIDLFPTHHFMNVAEYLLTRLFHYWLTGKKFDQTGSTLLDAETDSRQSVMVHSQLNTCLFEIMARNEEDNDPAAGPRRIYLVS